MWLDDILDLTIGDDDGRQRRDINATSDHVDSLEQRLQAAHADIAALRTQVLRLGATTGALIAYLVDEHLLDDPELRKRIEAALRPKPAPTFAKPNAGATAVCAKCTRTVPASQTNVTADAIVCDRCFAMG